LEQKDGTVGAWVVPLGRSSGRLCLEIASWRWTASAVAALGGSWRDTMAQAVLLRQ